MINLTQNIVYDSLFVLELIAERLIGLDWIELI